MRPRPPPRWSFSHCSARAWAPLREAHRFRECRLVRSSAVLLVAAFEELLIKAQLLLQTHCLPHLALQLLPHLPKANIFLVPREIKLIPEALDTEYIEMYVGI